MQVGGTASSWSFRGGSHVAGVLLTGTCIRDLTQRLAGPWQRSLDMVSTPPTGLHVSPEAQNRSASRTLRTEWTKE